MTNITWPMVAKQMKPRTLQTNVRVIQLAAIVPFGSLSMSAAPVKKYLHISHAINHGTKRLANYFFFSWLLNLSGINI